MENKTLKKRLKTATLILLTITMGLNGCKKDRSNQIAGLQKSFTTKQEAKIYLNQKLNEYGKIIAKLSQNAAMRRLVNERISLKFDGDYNVLLKDLVKPVSPEMFALKKGLNMSAAPAPASPDEPVQSVNLQELEQALTAPVLVNGETLYPQIYIPFFEEQEEVGPIEPIEPGDPGTPVEPDPCLNAIATAIPDYPNPVIVPYDGEEIPGQETFTGYTYDQQGTLIENIPVDECFAKRHRVWAITLNERVNDTGVIPPTTSGPTPATSPAQTGADIYISNLAIKENKESWIKGGSEIALAWILSWKNGLNPASGAKQTTVYAPLGDGSGTSGKASNEIGFFTRKEVRRETEKYINYTFASLSKWKDFDYTLPAGVPVSEFARYWSSHTPPFIYRYPNQGDYMYITIFEYDDHFWETLYSFIGVNSNAQTEDIYNQDGGFLETISFPSNENAYINLPIKIIPKNANENSTNTSNMNINNSLIKFSTRHR